jgi:tetratricopeptide (TPR) repeat protein
LEPSAAVALAAQARQFGERELYNTCETGSHPKHKAVAPMDLTQDTDSVVFHALRVFRNSFIAFCRERLAAAFPEALDREIKTLFKKEWEEIERSARQAHETGFVERLPIDALDHLSVNHVSQLIEKYWQLLSLANNPTSESARRTRAHALSLARDLTGIRNPVAHAPEEPLSLRDALRYIDSGVRLLDLFHLHEADYLRKVWSGVVADRTSEAVAPPAVLDTLPSREQITNDFVGRAEHLADLWRWLGEDTRRIWALVGDGGKGKTTIAYEFAARARKLLTDFGLQGVLWLTAKQRRFVEGKIVATASTDFVDIDSALNWILVAMGWPEEQHLPVGEKLGRCLEVLREFPMLVIADDIDSLERADEEAVELFAQHVPQTGSKVLLTSRREIFGLGGCTTIVSGMTEDEVREFLRHRAPIIGLDADKVNQRLVRRIQTVTDGSPLYIDDLLRLAHFYSLEQALDQWSGRRGDPAREYSLKREMEKLSHNAVSVLGVLAYSDVPVSLQECAVISGLSDEQAESAMGELQRWHLLVKPGIIEEIPRYTCSRNLAKLMRRTIEGTDQETRIRNGLKGLRGVAVGSSRMRGYIQQAVALKRRGDQAEAEATLSRGLAEVPNSGELHAMLGWLYAKWQPVARVADAEENFSRAEALGSWGRDLYAHWADMELSRNEVRKAIQLCERSVACAAQDDPFTWRLLGVSYIKLGQSLRRSLSVDQAHDAFGKARRALRRAQDLSAEPGDLSRSLNARYQLAKTTGDVDHATSVLKEWENLLPDDPYLAAVRR